MSTPEDPVRVEPVLDGACWRVVLDAPKGNVLDSAMIRALTRVAEQADACLHHECRPLRALLFTGEGRHFSFGASVEEHRPAEVGDMLPAFHALFRTLLDSRLFLLAAVRGQCLGGGLELAAFCHRLYASPDARLGQPEIRLGVFAPIGSLVLPPRVGRARAAELCLTGRVLAAEEALAWGLVDEVAEDPEAAALRFVEERLVPLSAAALRFAVAGLDAGYAVRFREDLARAEKLYLEGLMATHDAAEGIESFLAKREPAWRHA
ncbi:MAG: enoyl-CoA hydratase-related protein [Planctomycetota bacterium]